MHYYNRLQLIVTFCSIIFIGCSGLQVKRGVEENIFYSSSKPKISIIIDDAYSYIESESNLQLAWNDNISRVTDAKTVTYTFINNATKKRISVTIDTLISPRWTWKIFDFNEIPNIITCGTEVINKKKYQYGVYLNTDQNSCYLIKECHRLVGPNNEVYFSMLYAENLGHRTMIYLWKIKDLFTSEQKEHLRNFLEDFKKDIKVTDYINMTP